MDENTYYMDNNSFVTNRRVKVGNLEYDLAQIKWVGAEERLVGIRVGRFNVQANVGTVILVYLLVMALAMLLVVALPGYSKMIALSLILIAPWVMHGLMRWLGRRGHRPYLLGISGTFGTHYPIWCEDEQYLKRITDAIKQAMRDRYASLSDRQRVEHVTATDTVTG